MAKINVEIASVLKRKPILTPSDQPQNIENIKGGLINKKHWSIVYKREEGEVIKNSMFFLKDKHLYSKNALKTIYLRPKLLGCKVLHV